MFEEDNIRTTTETATGESEIVKQGESAMGDTSFQSLLSSCIVSVLVLSCQLQTQLLKPEAHVTQNDTLYLVVPCFAD